MKFNLDLIICNTEGALERVLGKLRQRSFALCAMSADCSPDNSMIKARITVQSDRPIEPAVKQLAKLYDVSHIAINAGEANVSHVFMQNDATESLELCASL